MAKRLLLACALVALTTACASERRAASRPAPTPVPRPSPAVPARAPLDWRDVPLTAGDWSYTAAPGGSAARFGPPGSGPLLTLQCERGQGMVNLHRAGSAAAAVPLTLSTSDGSRAFSASPADGQPPSLAVRFAPRDPFLDAMAFSRGRIAVEAPGLPALFLPAWPEIGRVIEDCR